MLNKIKETTQFLEGHGFRDAVTGLVLGTGLGAFAESIDIITSISYRDIPHFPVATVEFHKGRLLLAQTCEKKVMVMQGRFHYYEGYSMQEITFPVRVMKALGIQNLLLSNAAGGMNLDYKKGDLVLIEDHINQLPENPLRGLNDPAYGERFTDMSVPYSRNLNAALLKAAHAMGIELKKGVYVSVMGPNLETRAEYRFLRMIGADMVGMSTVPEVIVANQVGLPCAAISVITDECDPDNLKPVNIAEIIETAGKADEKLSRIFLEAIVNQL